MDAEPGVDQFNLAKKNPRVMVEAPALQALSHHVKQLQENLAVKFVVKCPSRQTKSN
jgi:hypothetical protein